MFSQTSLSGYLDYVEGEVRGGGALRVRVHGEDAAPEDNVERSPGRMLYVRWWNHMQYLASAAFLLSVYSGYLTEAGEATTPGTVTCAGGG